MSLVSSIQSRIETKIFSRLGSTITRRPYSSQSIDKWGDATVTYGTNESITGVPYSYFNSRDDFQPFGELADGETMIAVKYDQTVNINDLFVFDSKTFIVKEIEEFPLGDDNLLKVVRLSEQL